jgi:hypothetical protein
LTRPEKLKKYDKCGTVQDLVVSLLSASEDVKMSTQNAASWGYFLTETNQWDKEALSSGGFPLQLLPAEILMPGQTAGTLAHNWFGIPAGITIGHFLLYLFHAANLVPSHYHSKHIIFQALPPLTIRDAFPPLAIVYQVSYIRSSYTHNYITIFIISINYLLKESLISI